jgi:hypothetical protein
VNLLLCHQVSPLLFLPDSPAVSPLPNLLGLRLLIQLLVQALLLALIPVVVLLLNRPVFPQVYQAAYPVPCQVGSQLAVPAVFHLVIHPLSPVDNRVISRRVSQVSFQVDSLLVGRLDNPLESRVGSQPLYHLHILLFRIQFTRS